MIEFHERAEAVNQELAEAAEWLRSAVEAAAADRALRPLEWSVRCGERTTGGRAGVPVIRQRGCQVSGRDPATGADLPLPCFFEEATLTEDRALAQRIVELWLDRAAD